MKKQREEALALLGHNRGFVRPERWIDYAIAHDFRRVSAQILEECPDCQTRSSQVVGQFIYYSTLVMLKACSQCGLMFTDKRIDKGVIQAHFEHTYKDEDYFLNRRTRIFKQISRLVSSIAPPGGNVLDVGGAKGHLLAAIKGCRPDLNAVLNDLSSEACAYASSKYGFEAITGAISELEKIESRFDVVVMSDVIYYEPELGRLWRILPRLVADAGAVVIRVPNKASLIRSWQVLVRALSSDDKISMQDRIRFFNPEHLYVFTRQYLANRLHEIGFFDVRAVPSELLVWGSSDFMHPLYFHASRLVARLSSGRFAITPSLLMLGRRRPQ